MKIIYYILYPVLITFIACNAEIAVDIATATAEVQQPSQNYAQFKDSVKILIAQQSLEQKKQLLFDIVYRELPGYWLGTPWDFNGVTRTPKEGHIACGYFITNTLSDLGFDIKRIKLAQVASSVMIKELCVETKWISGFEAFEKHLSTQSGSGIYIVGLDFHTGYIIKTKQQSYFFHSNYIGSEGVVLEPVKESKALKASKVFFIGNLTKNDVLLKKWGL